MANMNIHQGVTSLKKLSDDDIVVVSYLTDMVVKSMLKGNRQTAIRRVGKPVFFKSHYVTVTKDAILDYANRENLKCVFLDAGSEVVAILGE